MDKLDIILIFLGGMLFTLTIITMLDCATFFAFICAIAFFVCMCIVDFKGG